MIEVGRNAPVFTAPSPVNPRFAFGSLGGRYLLMAFLPADPGRAEEMLGWIERHREVFGDDKVRAAPITRDPARFAAARNRAGLVWFDDRDGYIARGYGALDDAGRETGAWVLVDPMLRVMAVAEGAAEDANMFRIVRSLPAADDHAGVEMNAPILVVPRVFEPELCRRLIDVYDTEGGQISGTMQEIGGRTTAVVSEFKRRRDVTLRDQALTTLLRTRIATGLVPQIAKAFNYRVTRIERYIVACYDAEEGGWFNAHRDNTTAGTAHRRFACSINLNAGEFDGGDLRFPEFGSRTYRPPTGGAVVFSCSLLHEATPVIRGTRYAFLPFFFDEAGEELRQKNLHLLDQTPPAAEPVPA
jgi:predicted 2-oxoglutarate/Fe(II)-dependent dioxygenase YbiX